MDVNWCVEIGCPHHEVRHEHPLVWRNWHETDRLTERFWRALAQRLPRGLAYWAAVRVGTATSADPRYQDRAPTVVDALANWG